MRVLTIGNLFPPAALGGLERTWVDVLEALRAAGHAPSVLTTAPVAGAPVAPGADAGRPYPVTRALGWWWRDHSWRRPRPGEALRLERRNARILAAHLADADAVCLFGLGGMSLSVVEHVRRAGAPAVGVVGDAWMAYAPARDPWARAPLPELRERLTGLPAVLRLHTGARWLFNSRWTRAAAGVDGEIVHPGVDPARFPAVAAGPWRGRLLVAGRVEHAKGTDIAVAALGDLPGATLTVCGDGPLRLPGTPAVRRTRAGQEEMGAVYAAHDAVLFPVRWDEPWGLVPLEAMAVGRPVVATCTGGAAEYLRDGENCLVVPRDDAPALGAAVRRLGADVDLRERLVAGGRATAARFTRGAHDAAVVAALEAAVAGRP